jgi:8-oxo-dGTP diphosphatase
MKHYEVVAAIIGMDNKILCVQRNASKYDYISYKFEFPGGKVEMGESRKDALLREISEELSMHITIESEFLSVFHQYPDFSITMHSFMCIALSDSIHLKEHVAYKWLPKEKILDLEWAAADIPIVEKLLET